MEEQVQKFINEHSSGVMISEMETLLQQSRLRLGYVTNKLLNEGKVQKIDNRYYPASLALRENETPNF
jgi:predicted transcriptional regulator